MTHIFVIFSCLSFIITNLSIIISRDSSKPVQVDEPQCTEQSIQHLILKDICSPCLNPGSYFFSLYRIFRPNMDSSADRPWRECVELSIAQLQSGLHEILNHLHDQAPPASTPPPSAVSDSTPLSDNSISHEPHLCFPEFFRSDSEQCWAFMTQRAIHF